MVDGGRVVAGRAGWLQDNDIIPEDRHQTALKVLEEPAPPSSGSVSMARLPESPASATPSRTAPRPPPPGSKRSGYGPFC